MVTHPQLRGQSRIRGRSTASHRVLDVRGIETAFLSVMTDDLGTRLADYCRMRFLPKVHLDRSA